MAGAEVDTGVEAPEGVFAIDEFGADSTLLPIDLESRRLTIFDLCFSF